MIDLRSIWSERQSQPMYVRVVAVLQLEDLLEVFFQFAGHGDRVYVGWVTTRRVVGEGGKCFVLEKQRSTLVLFGF